VIYNETIPETFANFDSSEHGLSIEEAKKRLEKYGPNEIEGKKAEPLWKLVIHQFVDPLVVILLIAAIFTAIIGHYVDTWVILAVVFVNGLIGFFQEYKADKSMQALKNLTVPKATVIRNGKEERIDSKDVVPGDVVILSTGNKIPSDIRLFEVKELEIDESMLTGESVPVSKNTKNIDVPNLPLADQKNMVFMGTVITHGRGKGIVISTGKNTELGKISEEVKETVKERTPLQKRLLYFTRLIGVISVCLSVIVIVIGLIKGIKLLEIILFSISMAVAVIPEGLPIVITVTMAIGMKRMADKNAIIRKLIAVETLGSCNYICSDKTGTITENRMSVTKAFINGKEFEFSGIGYSPEGDVLLDGKKVNNDKDLFELLLTGFLCNTTNHYFDNDSKEWKIDGTATEGALIVAAKKYGISEDKEFNYELLDEIPFSSNRKYMAMLYKHEDKCTIYIKGAPENILKFSGNEKNEILLKQYSKMADLGLRVLGFGIKNIIKKCSDEIDLEAESSRDITFLGFIGIIDPPKKSAIEAIKGAHESGIRVVMITGDNKITAASIAKQVDILRENELVVTGQELDSNDDSFLINNVERITVYARVSPHHKLRIVDALQKHGNIVAVTGDGVNDAPALKKGNIGVAMGKMGTDVAREASDMVLKDDNFASIFEAVKVGRVIFDNIQKVSFFLLSSGTGIAFTIIAALLMDLPLPFLATQVLWVNLVTNGLQDVALAYEPGESDIHKRAPRNPKENILNKYILIRMVIVGIVFLIGTLSLFMYELKIGHTIEYARSTAFNTIVFFQFFHVWNSRSMDKSIFSIPFLSNPFLLISIFLSLIAQISVLTFEPLRLVFHTAKIDMKSWILTILVSMSIIIVIEIDKAIRKNNKRTSS